MTSCLKGDTFSKAHHFWYLFGKFWGCITGWWFETFFIFIPKTWENDAIWAYFSDWLKPPTRIYSILFSNNKRLPGKGICFQVSHVRLPGKPCDYRMERRNGCFCKRAYVITLIEKTTFDNPPYFASSLYTTTNIHQNVIWKVSIQIYLASVSKAICMYKT